MAYSVSSCRPDKRYQFRLELYIDTGDTEGTAQVFSALVKRRNEIEKIFGESLEWEPLGDRRASRIASYYRDDVEYPRAEELHHHDDQGREQQHVRVGTKDR